MGPWGANGVGHLKRSPNIFQMYPGSVSTLSFTPHGMTSQEVKTAESAEMASTIHERRPLMQMTPSTSSQRPQARPMGELERIERRMEKKWYDLAMAEQRKQPIHVLERMYDAYLRALDEYVSYQRGLSSSRRLAS
jgi:hypothetical protein